MHSTHAVLSSRDGRQQVLRFLTSCLPFIVHCSCTGERLDPGQAQRVQACMRFVPSFQPPGEHLMYMKLADGSGWIPVREFVPEGGFQDIVGDGDADPAATSPLRA